MANHDKAEIERCLALTNALLDAMENSVRESDPEDVWKYSSYKVYMRKYQEVADSVIRIDGFTAPIDKFDLAQVPDPMDTVAMLQKTYFDTTRANLHIVKAALANHVDVKESQTIDLTNFFEANLRRAVLAPPDNERDIQNVIEQLLIGRGLKKGSEYDRETGRVRISSKEAIPDFIFPTMSLALEAKLIKDKSRISTAIDEINADIASYSIEYSSLLFIVYDLGAIRDETEFRQGLEVDPSVRVLVVKH